MAFVLFLPPWGSIIPLKISFTHLGVDIRWLWWKQKTMKSCRTCFHKVRSCKFWNSFAGKMATKCLSMACFGVTLIQNIWNSSCWRWVHNENQLEVNKMHKVLKIYYFLKRDEGWAGFICDSQGLLVWNGTELEAHKRYYQRWYKGLSRHFKTKITFSQMHLSK